MKANTNKIDVIATLDRGELPRRRLGRTELYTSIVGAGGFLGMVHDPHQNRGDAWGSTVEDRDIREAAAVAAMRRGIELGINYFDTAPQYGGGEVERLLGVALRSLPGEQRDGLIISTKVGQDANGVRRYDGATARRSLEASLETLGCDRVSIVFVHDAFANDDLDQALAPDGAVHALEDLKHQGVISAIGLGVHILRVHERAIESGRFDVLLVPYHYSPVRDSGRLLFELAGRNGIGIVSASPYQAGLLSGIDPELAASKRADVTEPDLRRARRIWRWATERGIDAGALAMQYTLRNLNVGTALVGPRDAAEITGNVVHATTDLGDGIWDELDEFLSTLEPYAPLGED